MHVYIHNIYINVYVYIYLCVCVLYDREIIY